MPYVSSIRIGLSGMRRIHTFLIGIVAGLIGPIIGLYLYGMMIAQQVDIDGFQEFIEYAKSTHVEGKVLSFSMIFNLILFFVFINIEKWFDASRGVIFSSLIWAVPIVYYVIA